MAIIYIREKTKEDEIFDIYEAIPKSCFNGYVYIERRNFCFGFINLIDDKNNIDDKELIPMNPVSKTEQPTFKKFENGLNVVSKCK
jgi:hypothetical protein